MKTNIEIRNTHRRSEMKIKQGTRFMLEDKKIRINTLFTLCTVGLERARIRQIW